MTKERILRLLAQAFLTLAYLIVTLQWLWMLAIGLPPLIETGAFDSLAPPTPIEQSTEPILKMEFSPVLAIITGVITLFFLLLTVVIFIKIPKTISHTGSKLVHQATEAVIPVITHHKKIPATKKRELSRRIMMIFQLVLVAIPLVASFFLPALQTITSQIITTLAIWLAIASTLCFITSWLVQPKATSRIRSRESRG